MRGKKIIHTRSSPPTLSLIFFLSLSLYTHIHTHAPTLKLKHQKFNFAQTLTDTRTHTCTHTTTHNVRRTEKSILIIGPAVLDLSLHCDAECEVIHDRATLSHSHASQNDWWIPLFLPPIPPFLMRSLPSSLPPSPSSSSLPFAGSEVMRMTLHRRGLYANEISDPATHPSPIPLPPIHLQNPDRSWWAGKRCLMQTKWRRCMREWIHFFSSLVKSQHQNQAIIHEKLS